MMRKDNGLMRKDIWKKHLAANYDTDLDLQNVAYDAAASTARRCTATHTRNDGTTAPLLLEWVTSIPTGLPISLVQLRDELPTDQTRRHGDEVRTLRLAGIHREEGRAALAYELDYVPATLRDVFENVPKPSRGDRCVLARLIVAQVRSLHLHFRNKHLGLRTESIVFLRDPSTKKQNGANGVGGANGGKSAGVEGLDMRHPVLLDWGCEASPSMYQHPDFSADKKLWYYDVWSLLVVLAEVSAWKPLANTAGLDAEKLRARKIELAKRAMRDGGASVFRFGFGFLDGKGLEGMTYGNIKRFFDRLCELIEDASAMG